MRTGKFIHTYKPLPEELTILPSTVHGLGLFAKKDINMGMRLGISHVEVLIDGKVKLIRTPCGGFINHSDKPNLELVRGDNNCYEIVAIENIEFGKELFLDYSTTPCVDKKICNEK